MVYGHIFNKKSEEVPYTLKLISILKGFNINNPRKQQIFNKLVHAFNKKTFKQLFFNGLFITIYFLSKLMGQSFASLLNIYCLKQQNIYLVDG